MALPLPFADDEFDAAICLEGVEHLVNPVQLKILLPVYLLLFPLKCSPLFRPSVFH
jgi:hypothetical protein